MERRAGFTLLEIMLAITIFGLVLTTIYGTFARTLRSRDLAGERAEITRTGRTAVVRLADEIASAFYPQPRPAGALFRSLALGTESVPLDALVFSALSTRQGPGDLPLSDQRVISYFFPQRDEGMGRRRERDLASDDVVDFFAAFGPERPPVPGTTPKRLLRREAVMGGEDAIDAAPATLFLDGVASLDLRFSNGSEWLERWDSEDRATARLPRAVAIDLALYDASGEVHHFATAVDLPLASPGARSSGLAGGAAAGSGTRSGEAGLGSKVRSGPTGAAAPSRRAPAEGEAR